jgi:putrescine aminotransferase
MADGGEGVVSRDEKEKIFRLFAEHISEAQIKFLHSGALDVIEGERKGGEFIDAKTGKTIIDGFNGAGCFNVGRGNPEVIAALGDVVEDLDMGSHHLLSRPKIEFARKLTSVAPGDLNRVVFSCGGGEAIGSALKLALGATGRSEIIAMELAYHGHSGFSLSAGGKKYYREFFEPLMPNFKFVPFNDLQAMKAAASEKTAAIILEPILGEGGIHVATDEYLKGLRQLCDDLGIILIFDEIQTGFGRTGKLFFCEYSGVVPDVLVVSKSLSGGLYPNAAIVYRDVPLLTDFVDENPDFHASWGGGTDLGCTVSAKAIDFLVENRVPENAAEKGERLKAGLVKIMEENSGYIKEVRGRGMMLAMEYKYNILGPLMSFSLSLNGILAAYSSNAPQVMRFMFAPTITDEEVDKIIELVRKSVKYTKWMSYPFVPLLKIPRTKRFLDDDHKLIKLFTLMGRVM